MNAEIEYLKILDEILKFGVPKSDRTNTGNLELFGRSIRHNYEEGFPLLTTKKMFSKGIIIELLWFLKNTEDPSYMLENGVHIWDGWMKEDENGKKTLPHTYGKKWRDFYGCDQVSRLINDLKTNPNSRRHVVSAWDAANVNNAALPWCHILWQINVHLDEDKPPEQRKNDGKKGDISIAVYQRSADTFLGVSFNLASYSFLLYMIAEITGYRPKEMYYTFGSIHIYNNHIEQCKLQLTREPYFLPKLALNHKDNIDDFVYEDFKILDYNYHPTIKAEVSI